MQAKEIKNGAVLNYNDAPTLIESVSVQTPSARGAATLYKFRGRNLVTKQKVDITPVSYTHLTLPTTPYV